MLLEPLPAPNFHSAKAQALASFCIKVGTPIFSFIISTIGILSQPGKLGGERMIPVLLFNGPPQLIPIAFIFRFPIFFLNFRYTF